MANPIGYTTAAEVERLREGKTAVVQGEATAEGVPVFLKEPSRTRDAIGSGVKALEWEEVGDEDECTAEGVSGGYLIAFVHTSYRVLFSGISGGSVYQAVIVEGLGLEAAKAAAEDHNQNCVRDWLTLSTHTAAGAGPVGEAVAWRDMTSAARKPMQPVLLWDGKKVFEGYWGASHFDRKSREWVSAWVSSPTSGDTKPTHWAPLPGGPDATRPVEEPGEVERLTRERDEALAGWETANAKRIASERDRIAAEAALAETREEAAQLTSERDNAVAAAKMLTGSHAKIRDELAETREGLEKLLAAVGKARTSLAGFTSADDAAFALDVAIGEVADWKRRALTGDAQEGGK